MKRMLTFPRLGVLVALGAVLAIVAVQAASGAGAVIVRGDQLVLPSPNSCPAEPGTVDGGTYLMRGDLVGCWYTDVFNVTQQKNNPGGAFKASGMEHFEGCLNTDGDDSCAGERTGRFNTTFTFTAKIDPTIGEIHGRCHHPIVSGSGVFAGASGVISFKDIPPEGRFPYHGNIQLGGRGNGGAGAAGASALSVGASAEADASAC